MTRAHVLSCLLLLVLCACGGKPEKPPYPGIKLGKPYDVMGQHYSPHYDAHYDETGIASWYGPGFHGGHTANGERYDQDELTAAHRTLPLPCIVRVTNLDNGVSALIRINDRGPFAHNRIIDLSHASAKKLGIIRTGTAHVRVQFLEAETKQYVESLGYGQQFAKMEADTMADDLGKQEEAAPGGPVLMAPPAPEAASVQQAPAQQQAQIQVQALAAPTAPAQDDEFAVVETPRDQPRPADRLSEIAPAARPAAASGYFIQAGTFGSRENAMVLSDRLAEEGQARISDVTVNGRTLYRVLLGPYETRDGAKNMLSNLASAGISDARIVHN